MKLRHRWGGKVGNSQDGLVVSCMICGMVKQTIKGFPTYFINDTLYDKIAPPCINLDAQTDQQRIIHENEQWQKRREQINKTRGKTLKEKIK